MAGAPDVWQSGRDFQRTWTRRCSRDMRGDVTYYPKAIGPDGTPGLYRFAFQPNDSYSFAEISVAYDDSA